MKKLSITNIQFKELLEDFSRYVEQIGYSESGCKKFPRNVQEFLYKLEHQDIDQVNKIKPEHIASHHRYLEERANERGGALSAATIEQHLYALQVFFNWLELTGKLTANPMTAFEYARSKTKEREILTRTEIESLYNAAESLRDKAMLSLIYGCGLRRSEAVKLNIQDVSFRTGVIYIREGKGKKRRVIPMSKKVNEDLKNYFFEERNQYITLRQAQTTLRQAQGKDSEEAFILSAKGNRLCGEAYNHNLKRLLKKAKIEKNISLHHLRHSIATHLLENGLSMEKVSEFLGHEQLDATQIYAHIFLFK